MRKMRPLTPEQKEHIRVLEEEALEERRAEANRDAHKSGSYNKKRRY